MQLADKAMIAVASPELTDPVKVAAAYVMASPKDFERRLMLASVLSESGSAKAAQRQLDLVACLRKRTSLHLVNGKQHVHLHFQNPSEKKKKIYMVRMNIDGSFRFMGHGQKTMRSLKETPRGYFGAGNSSSENRRQYFIRTKKPIRRI